MIHETETITSQDGTTLHMQSWLPDDTPHSVIALIHGWSDHSSRYTNLVNHLVPLGYGIYAVDLRGHGLSEGKRGHVMRWDEYREDAEALVATVHTYHPDTPLFLYGHSMGGLIVMEYAIHYPNENFCGVVISAPLLAQPRVNPALRSMSIMLSRIYPTFTVNPGTDVTTVSRDPDVVDRYKTDPLGHDLVSMRLATEIPVAIAYVLANLKRFIYPTLLIYGSDDKLVPQQTTRDMFDDLGSTDKTRYEYNGGYHEVINDLVKEQVLADITTWLEAHRQPV